MDVGDMHRQHCPGGLEAAHPLLPRPSRPDTGSGSDGVHRRRIQTYAQRSVRVRGSRQGGRVDTLPLHRTPIIIFLSELGLHTSLHPGLFVPASGRRLNSDNWGAIRSDSWVSGSDAVSMGLDSRVGHHTLHPLPQQAVRCKVGRAFITLNQTSLTEETVRDLSAQRSV